MLDGQEEIEYSCYARKKKIQRTGFWYCGVFLVVVFVCFFVLFVFVGFLFVCFTTCSNDCNTTFLFLP